MSRCSRLEDVFGGQRLGKGKVLLVDCTGNAPLAQVAEPDGGIEGHRQAAALRDHLHDLAAAQQREDLPQLAGINGLNGGPQLLFAVCQNVQNPSLWHSRVMVASDEQLSRASSADVHIDARFTSARMQSAMRLSAL